MDNIEKLKHIGMAIQKCENAVAVMEAQKKELDAVLEENGFNSVEELESAIEGMSSVIAEEEERLTAKVDELQSRISALAD